MECPISTREKGQAGQLGATLVCLSVVMSNEHTSLAGPNSCPGPKEAERKQEG